MKDYSTWIQPQQYIPDTRSKANPDAGARTPLLIPEWADSAVVRLDEPDLILHITEDARFIPEYGGVLLSRCECCGEQYDSRNVRTAEEGGPVYTPAEWKAGVPYPCWRRRHAVCGVSIPRRPLAERVDSYIHAVETESGRLLGGLRPGTVLDTFDTCGVIMRQELNYPRFPVGWDLRAAELAGFKDGMGGFVRWGMSNEPAAAVISWTNIPEGPMLLCDRGATVQEIPPLQQREMLQVTLVTPRLLRIGSIAIHRNGGIMGDPDTGGPFHWTSRAGPATVYQGILAALREVPGTVSGRW